MPSVRLDAAEHDHTLAHFSVSSMISFSKSAGEPDNAEPPIVGSASAVLISFRLTKENPQGRGRSLGALLCSVSNHESGGS